jgi:hypothetical protein
MCSMRSELCTLHAFYRRLLAPKLCAQATHRSSMSSGLYCLHCDTSTGRSVNWQASLNSEMSTVKRL